MTTHPDDSSDTSDYGDFTPDEEELVNELLAKAVSEHATALHSTTSDSQTPDQPFPPVGDIEDYDDGPRTRSPKTLGREKLLSPRAQRIITTTGPSQTPGYRDSGTAFGKIDAIGASNGTDKLTKRLVEDPKSTEGRQREKERQISREQDWAQTQTQDPTNANANAKTPLERFRKPPNKSFSVTDLISPAWCELQYWYTLTKFGRKRRTPAMKQGTSIHKTLEDEVHTTVPVEVTTKEDAWALRMWNVIQGLRTLREFGTTRELEVWGVVDGELVNGVIDHLSIECPDSGLESEASGFYADVEASRRRLPEYQMSLTDYLLSPSQGGGKRLGDVDWNDREQGIPDDKGEVDGDVYSLPRIYMTDVKTRGSSSLPTVKSSSFRPTLLQLQLYYHMLNRMVTTDDVSMDLLASRYGLDPNRRFTDAFIAEVGGLNDQFFDALSSQEFDPDHIPTPEDACRIPHRDSEKDNAHPSSSSQDSTTILLEHNTLASLWRLMKDQLRLTFLPHPSKTHKLEIAPSIPAKSQPTLLESYPTLLSPLLTAEFISSTPTPDSESRVLGCRSFLFDPASLTSYLSDQMEWWRGQRAPRGVEVMEAWKCRVCEFRDECSWRKEKELALANGQRRRSRG